MSDLNINVSSERVTATLSVNALRRASPMDGPTRTLRITEAEHSSRGTTPISVDVLLAGRPRSNPRQRTPMRYESPLNPNEFRRESLVDSSARHEAPRISIRPMAGRPVGTVASTRIHEESASTKSRKQGPSHRKIRRWNNEHFAGLAHEISKSRGYIAAEVLLRAHEDAHLYRDVYDPKDHKSQQISRFMEDEKLKSTRELFFDGEGPRNTITIQPDRNHNRQGEETIGDMMLRVDPRLRQVLIKACANSYPATKVVGYFEDYLVTSFGSDRKRELPEDWWVALLLEPPSSVTDPAGVTTAKFFFNAESSTGGFHRLLLHGVAQFHGLNITSKITKTTAGTDARALIVSGRMNSVRYYLLQHLVENSQAE